MTVTERVRTEDLRGGDVLVGSGGQRITVRGLSESDIFTAEEGIDRVLYNIDTAEYKGIYSNSQKIWDVERAVAYKDGTLLRSKSTTSLLRRREGLWESLPNGCTEFTQSLYDDGDVAFLETNYDVLWGGRA